jgi:hypothetical protein
MPMVNRPNSRPQGFERLLLQVSHVQTAIRAITFVRLRVLLARVTVSDPTAPIRLRCAASLSLF